MALHTVPIICSNHVFQGYSAPILRPGTGFCGTDHFPLSLSSQFPAVFFLFFSFLGAKKSKKISSKAGYPRQPWHSTLVLKYLRVTSSPGSNISRQQWQLTVHRERKKKPQYRLRKWPWEVPAPQSWSPKCVERSHQRHIPKLQLCNFHLGFQPRAMGGSREFVSSSYSFPQHCMPCRISVGAGLFTNLFFGLVIKTHDRESKRESLESSLFAAE